MGPWDIQKNHPLGGSSYFWYAVHNRSSFFVPFLFDGTPSISWSKFLWLKKNGGLIPSPFTTSTDWEHIAHPPPPDLAAGRLVRSDLKYHRVPHRSGLGRIDGFSQPKDFFIAMQTNCTSTWAGLKMYSLLNMWDLPAIAMLDYWRVNEWLVGGFNPFETY